MPILTFRCCNSRCGREYDSYSTEPRCPTCRSKRAQWVPVKVAIRKVAPQVDRDMRVAAEQYGMSDFRTARMGEKMAPPRSKTPSGVKLDQVTLAGAAGQGVPVYRGDDGNIIIKSVCVPSGVTSSVRPRMGVPIPERGPSLLRNTVFEGKTIQRTVPLDDHT